MPADLDDLDVLIVDDDLYNRKALSEYVLNRNGNVLLVSSLADGVKLRDCNHIDFAIIDDMLNGDKTGLDFASHLANEVSLKRIIVVAGSILPERIKSLNS